MLKLGGRTQGKHCFAPTFEPIPSILIVQLYKGEK